MQLFKINKYKSAGLVSVSIHIMALGLASSWVIHNKKEIHEEKKVIINVRLEKPKIPKIPQPVISSAEEIPIVNSKHGVKPDHLSALPLENISGNPILTKTPTKLTTQSKLARIKSSTISPLAPKNIHLPHAAANFPSEIIDVSGSKVQTMNINARNPAINVLASSKHFKPSKIATSEEPLRKHIIKPNRLNTSKQQPRTDITSIGFHQSNFNKVSTNHPKLSPKVFSQNESSITKAVSHSKSTSSQNIRRLKQNNQPKVPVEIAKITTESIPTRISKPLLNDKHYLTTQIALAAALDSPPSFNANSIQPSQHQNFPIFSNLDTHIKARVITTETSDSKIGTRQSSVIKSNIDSKYSTTYKVIPKSYFQEHQMSPENSIQPAIAHKNNNVIQLNSKPRLASLHTDTIKPIYPGAIVNEELTQLRKDFNRRIRDRIAQVKSYPSIAKRRGFEGEPIVSFTINKNGSLTNYSLLSSSGHRILDKSALETVKKAVPYPKIPDKLNIESIKLKLPISYNLK